MRILHVISSVNPAGGGPIEGIRQITAVVRLMGHTTEIASIDAPDAPWLSQCPLKVHALGPGSGTYNYSRYVVPWLQAHHNDYDAVVVNGIWQYSSFAVWRALRRTQTPYFVFTHGMLDPWFKQAYPLKHLKKSLYWRWGEFRVLRDAQAVCFTCEEERILARQSFRCYQVHEAVVSYGTATPEGDSEAQRQTFLSLFPELENKRILLFLSRIHPKKGCDLLIEAFARVASEDSTLHLVIAGPDQTGWKTQLQQQANRLGISSRITWPGMLRDDSKWGAYHAAEAFVLPSHQENFGIVVAEALASGLPVLISNKVNIWREIEKEGAGFVAPDTQQGTIQLLHNWLNAPAPLKSQMGQNAIYCFEQHFEIHQAAQSLLNVFQSNGIKE